MKMLTLRLKPKTLFGLILVLTGVIVIVITFTSNHIKSSERVMSSVTLETNDQREEYLTSLGWEFKTNCDEKQVQIPSEFNDVYTRYNEIQKSQGFDLEPYKGQEVTVYTYNITNYAGYENRDCIYANLIVCNNMLIGGDVCSTSVSDGFMQALKKQQ
ncbi:MAG: DUF4830 domain-containing protein [Eubacterium sp.]|jgi:hypothetical protein|nr:DUF4830 domain-containing protein [Eubacterium sp.]